MKDASEGHKKDKKRFDFDEKKVFKWILVLFFIVILSLLIFYDHNFTEDK